MSIQNLFETLVFKSDLGLNSKSGLFSLKIIEEFKAGISSESPRYTTLDTKSMEYIGETEVQKCQNQAIFSTNSR